MTSMELEIPRGGERADLRPHLIDRVLNRLEALIRTLDDSQLAAACLPYTARHARAWSNYPQASLPAVHRRSGLSTATLTASQWGALEAVLAVLLGSAPGTGLDRIRQHLDADDYLASRGGQHGYGRTEFFVAILGRPATTGIWQFQFGGHHLAVAHTFVNGTLVGLTPSFRGIEPFGPFRQHGRTGEPEARSARALRALLAGLRPEQLDRARLPGRHTDLLLGPGQDWCFPVAAHGVAGSALTDAQRQLLRAAIATYVGDVEPGTAGRIMADYTSELARTRIAFAGSSAVTAPGDYVRIDGPRVWLEFSMHDGIVLPGPHPHAVWRDRTTDYGGSFR